ncbi:MAG: hypothetical protein ABJL67_11570 [Sulfitobacter sp.]
MLDFENDPDGAYQRVGDRIKGELIMSFADIQERTGLTSTELGRLAVSVLLDRIRRQDGLEAHILFSEKIADTLATGAKGIREILEEDHRRQMN